MVTVVAPRALTISPGGDDLFAKSADTLASPASMTKIVTAYTARQFIPDMTDTMSVVSADLKPGSTAGLLAGDVLTYEDAFYGMMLPSGNDAATAIARNVGAQIGGGDSLSVFHAEMAAQMNALGLTGTTWLDSSGLSNNQVTIRQICLLLQHIDEADPWLRQVMGTLTYAITITGANARTINVTHTIDPTGPVPLPEFVSGKTGTGGGATGACVAILWDHAGRRYVTGLMGSTAGSRFPDLRALMDDAIATTSLIARRRGAIAAL